ncbi:MAG: FAD binding domain-containing protein [Gracilibacteraceae bacterium]|jgi:xanthine dehydrogenase YagS FAD-binding subunit|nr:FAD binding domain-containing protein [Gracilibacteraceae bacterium]
MRSFAHFNAATVDEAVSVLRRYGGKATVIAGGTDVLGRMKDEILPAYPEALVNIKTIPGLDFIDEIDGVIIIGALTRLEDIALNRAVQASCPALAEAARRTASTHLREMGTIGGNICQDVRCWYYRNPDNRFSCLKKGGGRCYAINGDNRYHSIFGGSVDQGCYAVHVSDMAPALVALDAAIKTSRREVRAEEFFKVGMLRTTILDDDEIVTEIKIPKPVGWSAFFKFALRKAIDFPIVNCAAMMALAEGKVTEARICLNAVHGTPYRARKAEEVMIGVSINEDTAEAAGSAAISAAIPLTKNGYMVQIAKTMVKRAILACNCPDKL